MPGTLTHSPADIARWLLISMGLGSDPTIVGSDGLPSGAWPILATSEPSKPDNCITIYDTSGIYEGRTQVDGEVQQHEAIQIRIRATTHAIGWAKADAIREAIDEQVYLDEVTVPATADVPIVGHYIVGCFVRKGTIIVVGKDTPDTKRNIFTINSLIQVQEKG